VARIAFRQKKEKVQGPSDSGHDYPIAPNILDRDFTVPGKNQVRVSDMAHIRTGEGWMCLTVIMDPFHRRAVGWSMGKTFGTAEPIIPAWKMPARSNDTTDRPVFHCYREHHYAGYEFTDILKAHNGPLVRSMGRKGNCWDNAVAVPFFKSLKVEWAYHQNYSFRSEAEPSIFQWIGTWHNGRSIHSTLDHKTIEGFENEMYVQRSAA
jgi:transposase InsO family protein